MKLDFKIGDHVECNKRKMRGFVTRLNALGLTKKGSVGIQWVNGKRDTIVGLDCMHLKKIK